MRQTKKLTGGKRDITPRFPSEKCGVDSTIYSAAIINSNTNAMILEKTKITYHGDEYDGVYVTLEEGEETSNTEAGTKMLFASIELWIDIIGEETLKSDRADVPQDAEGEKVDETVYYYDLSALFYCLGEMSREEFTQFAMDCID